jgi:hypothetical protein
MNDKESSTPTVAGPADDRQALLLELEGLRRAVDESGFATTVGISPGDLVRLALPDVLTAPPRSKCLELINQAESSDVPVSLLAGLLVWAALRISERRSAAGQP